jgi:hypothetical protein
MVLPTLMLWVSALAMGVAGGMSPAERLPWRAELVSRVVQALILSTWVIADAQKRNWPLFHDYASFVFFAWMVVVPIYLFRTRGARAFLTLLCFVGISVSSTMIATVIFIVRQIVFDKASV